MPFFRFILIFCILLMFLQCKHETVEKTYNMLPKKAVTENYFGESISDPYRFMENTKDTNVIKWYKKQKELTKQLLVKIPLENQLTTFKEKEIKGEGISSLKISNNDRYFYIKSNSKKLFYKDKIDGKEILLFNPETLNSKSNINYFKPNWDGSKIAISLTKDDSEIGSIVIYDVVQNKLHKETLLNCWPSALGGVRWHPNNRSFTYEYIPVIDKSSENYLLEIETLLHTVGTDFKSDKILFSKKNNPEILIKKESFPEVTFKKEKSNLMISGVFGASYYADHFYAPIEELKDKHINWKPLFKKEDLVKKFFIDKNDDIIFLNAKNASNFKISKISISSHKLQDTEVLIKEDSLAVISDFTLTSRGIFYVKTFNGVKAELFRFQNGATTKIPLPKPSGYINVSSKGASYEDLWIEIKGWTNSRERYKFNYNNNSFELEKLLPNQEFTNIEDVIIQEIEITSHDGVKVPLSIIHKKGLELNGNNRLLITGYGAYGMVNKPRLRDHISHWVEAGGIYAVAHVRGGGEKGDGWHKSGYKLTKPNSWKDFIACTEYFIENKYTSNNKIAAFGASAGGVLVGRAITERPDLYAAAIIRVGILNTLRLDFAPNGKNSTREFGSIKDSLGFKALLQMDSYHHVKKGVKYPAMYITAGMNDARVAVWQPAKFAAKLQNATSSDKPVLFDVDFEGGHGLDSSPEKVRQELINVLSFALWQTGDSRN